MPCDSHTCKHSDHENQTFPPPKTVGKKFFKALWDAVSYVASFSAVYVAGQLWYNAVTIDVVAVSMRSQVGDFASYSPNQMAFSGLVSQASLLDFTIFCIFFNLGLFLLVYLFVKLQVWLNNKQIESDKRSGRKTPGPWIKAAVMLAKTIDAFADGVTFFSTNIVYVVLLSALVGSDSGQMSGGRSEYLVIPFSFAVTIVILFCIGLTEAIPFWWYSRKNDYTADKRKTVEFLNDYWIANWAWLIGFAWWTVLLVVLAPFFRLGLGTYWFILFIILLLFLGQVAFFAHRSVSTALDEQAFVPSITMSLTETIKPRIVFVFNKGMNWIFGVGLYFTTKNSIGIFDAALNPGSNVPLGQLWAFVTVATLLLLAVVVWLEWNMDSVRLAEDNEHAGARQSAVRWCVCVCVPAPKVPDFRITFYKNMFRMIRLSCAYVTGKVWLAVQIGFLGDYVVGLGMTMATMTSAFFWTLVPLAQATASMMAMAETMWKLRTEERLTENHSDMCACPHCAPEFYPALYEQFEKLSEDKSAMHAL